MTTQTLPTGTWSIDPAATTITVTATKLGFLSVPATADLMEGSITIADDGSVSNVEVIVDAASYTSKNPKRNEHVVSADFFDAGNHPTIEFRSSSVGPTGAGWRAEGTLTIKGNTSPLTLDITDLQNEDSTPSFTVAAAIDRSKAGVDKMPSFVIGNTIDLTATVGATTATKG